MNAFCRLFNVNCQTLESHCRVDKVAQDELCGLGFTVQKKHNRLIQHGTGKLRIPLNACQNHFFKVFGDCHIHYPLRLLIAKIETDFLAASGTSQ
jgi:hypothetical protein